MDSRIPGGGPPGRIVKTTKTRREPAADSTRTRGEVSKTDLQQRKLEADIALQATKVQLIKEASTLKGQMSPETLRATRRTAGATAALANSMLDRGYESKELSTLCDELGGPHRQPAGGPDSIAAWQVRADKAFTTLGQKNIEIVPEKLSGSAAKAVELATELKQEMAGAEGRSRRSGPPWVRVRRVVKLFVNNSDFSLMEFLAGQVFQVIAHAAQNVDRLIDQKRLAEGVRERHLEELSAFRQKGKQVGDKRAQRLQALIDEQSEQVARFDQEIHVHLDGLQKLEEELSLSRPSSGFPNAPDRTRTD